MNTLKDRINQHTETPDPKVWDNISRTLRIRRIRRATLIGTGAAAAVALAVILIRPADKGIAADSFAENHVAATPTMTVAKADIPQSPAVVATTTEATVAAPVALPETAEPSAVNPAPEPAELQPVATVIADTVKLPSDVKEQKVGSSTSVKDNNVSTSASVKTTVAPTESDSRTVATTDAPTPYSPVAVKAKNNASDTTVAEEQNLWIPNAIRPNDDNEKNRCFKPIFTKPEEISHYELQIFARGGHRVYVSKNLNDNGWDGRSDGRYVPTGAYVYLMTYRDAANIVRQKRGTVTVIYQQK